MILLYHAYLFCILFFFVPIVSLQSVCDGPQRFSDFSIVEINSVIYLTGGNPTSSDIWGLNLTAGIDTNQCLPWQGYQPISNSSAIQPYMYGVAFRTAGNGLIVQTGDGGTPAMTNGVKYDTDTNGWINMNTQGQVPVVRAEMTVSLNSTTNQAWYYGGRNTQSQQTSGSFNYYNDFYFLDTVTNTWNWPTVFYTGGIRPSRFGHTSSLIMGQLFILGGKTAVMNSTDNTWIVGTADFRSVLVFDTLTNASISMATINDIPQGLSRFSATNAPDGRSIVIFGGKMIDRYPFTPTNNVYVLDTCTLSWSTPNIQGVPPIPRAGHEAITFGHYMFVIGGITSVIDHNSITYADDVAILDMSTWTWVKTIPAGVRSTQPINPGCRFDLPVSPNDNTNNNNNDGGLPYDSTVVSNPNINDNTALKQGLGIGFGVFGVLLCGCLVFYVRRIRQDAQVISPRWLPAVFTRTIAKTSMTSSTRSTPSTSSSLASASSDTKTDAANSTDNNTKIDVPMFVITEHP